MDERQGSMIKSMVAALGRGAQAVQVWLDPPPEPAKALGCGCPADGRPVLGCVHCGYSRCDEHRDDPHPCRPKTGAEPGVPARRAQAEAAS